MSLEWYESLREKNRPERLELLLVGESPPDAGSGTRRFFYSPQLLIDNLYRGVAEAVYGEEPDFDVTAKQSVLKRLRSDGFWLIDAVPHPTNRFSMPDRRKAIEENVGKLVARCLELRPRRGVIICHGMVFEKAAMPLRQAGIAVLHDSPLPFPLGNWRSKFVEGMREALKRKQQ